MKRLKTLNPFNHFKDIFQEQSLRRPKLDLVAFDKLSPIETANLELLVLLDDIKEVVWYSTCNKSPSSGKFNMDFYEATWEIIKLYYGNSLMNSF